MKYFIITYGCQMNHSDSERIAAKLNNSGHKPAKTAEQANLLVINACSVRESAMHRTYAKINKFYSARGARLPMTGSVGQGSASGGKDKKIILAGCVLETDKKKLQGKFIEFWHPDDYFEKNHICSISGGPTSGGGRTSQNYSALVPIMTGCNNFCSYCVVPYTRGQEKSRPADKIIKEVKLLIKKGHKEIMLLGQNVNSYRGSDKNSSSEALAKEDHLITFPALLRLLNSLPGEFTIKFMTSHPKDMSDELIHIIASCDKVSKEIHLPIQSGDNTILKKMNRKYTVARYKKLIKKIRQKIPNATISTDIIVGFPEETKKQFQNTVKLFKELKFAKAYVVMYSPRPGTAAYKLTDNVPHTEKKRRWKILDKIANKKTVGILRSVLLGIKCKELLRA